jgi:hypothetical protein
MSRREYFPESFTARRKAASLIKKRRETQRAALCDKMRFDGDSDVQKIGSRHENYREAAAAMAGKP